MSQLQIIKRNGKPVDFDKKKIEQALINAFSETEQGVDYDLIADIAESIEEELVDLDLVPTVESVQDMVEMSLMESDRKDVARQYILYRNERSKVRESGIKDNYKMITSDFVSKYKHQPSPMTNLGNFVFYRTYSRWLDNEKRREFWWETARRAVEFNTSLAPTTKEEAKQLYDNVFNLRQFLSGRTFWIGNTDVSRNYALSNFNCSAVVIDSYKMFAEMFYLLLVGAGAGIRVMPEDVAKMPKIRTDVKMINKSYVPVPKRDRIEYTSLMFEDDIAEIVVGDSKEAWMQSLERFFEILTTKQYSKVSTIIMNYDNIRSLGERLKTFGGTASGHTALEEIFTKIDKMLRKHRDQPAYQLSTVDCLDIANIIGAGVVVGGVRRTSEIGLGSIDDKDFVEAKSNLYTQENGAWKINDDIIHRQMSNNSIFYNSKPTREQLHWQVTQMKVSAEPGFINAEAARKRRDNFNAVNPCGEILLDSQQCCNLTTVNAMAFVQDGKLNKEELLKAQRLSARAGYRMTFLELELHDWNLKQKRDRLIGCSLTGWQDMINATGITKDEEAALLRDLRTAAHQAVEDYAKQLGANAPLLSTTVKPEGCATKDHTRTLDNGIFFIDEINPDIDLEFGFKDLDGQLSFNNNTITKTYKNDVKETMRITLKNGRKLDVSPAHPMSVNGKWIPTKDLQVGDKLDYELGFYRNNVNVPLKFSSYIKQRNADIFNTPTYMSEDLAWLIGAYYANGSFTTQHRIKFHCEHKAVHLKVQKIWKELFEIETEIVKCADRNSYVQDFANANIRQWFIDNGLEKQAGFNRIPLAIRKSSYKSILAFITGYADNDGCFHAKTFCIDSSNEVFIRHLQEVGEAVGLSFSVSINSKRGDGAFSQNAMYKAHLSRSYSNKDAIEYINSISVKTQFKGLIEKGIVKSQNPYIITSVNSIGMQETYDIEVDNIHWYYQGGLKSHNTISQMPTVSSGVHYSHSPYFVRRVRVSAKDPVLKVCEELGYPVFPEVGQDPVNPSTKVVEFPVKAPEGRTKYDVSAIEQLENYKMFMENYVDHNCSITVHVRENEWEDVEQWMWDNWDLVVGVSFISLDDSFYELLPYEAITEREYNERASVMRQFAPSLIGKYETIPTEAEDLVDSECTTGSCPIR